MEKKDVLTKILAIVGAVLVWLPILAPVILAFVALGTRGRFLFDYLMPAELFLFVLAGGGLLIWASLRTRGRLTHIAWSLGLAAGLLVGAQALAVVTGLASGRIEPTGLWWVLVLTLLALFWLALISLGVGGILLSRDQFGSTNP